MAYKDDRSDSLQLIPNGVGFDDSTPQMSVEQLAAESAFSKGSI